MRTLAPLGWFLPEPRSRHVGKIRKRYRDAAQRSLTSLSYSPPYYSRHPTEMTCLLDLSHELLQSILGEVDGHDLAALSATCRAFNSFVTGNRILCKSVYLRAWVGEARSDLIVHSTDVIDRTIQSKLSLAGRRQYATWSHYRRYWRAMTSKQRSSLSTERTLSIRARS